MGLKLIHVQMLYDLVCDLVYDSFINRNDVILKFISLAQ